jgi:hypothetical protein
MRVLNRVLTMAVVMGTFFSSSAFALILPDPATNAFQFGNFWSYSLPILAFKYNAAHGGGVGPGNPFYIQSTPGAIKNDIVLLTGASGGGVTTNFPNMDDAFAASQGPVSTFTQSSANEPPPTFPGDILGTATAGSGAWDTTIAALKAQLVVGGVQQSPIFLFNNNQTKSGSAADENLLAWGQIWFQDTDGVNPNLIFDFTNTPPGGAPGGDPTTYTDVFGINGTPSNPSDYVLSGGAISVDAAGNIVPVGTPGSTVINHNLGANQAAYAITSPGINDFLASALSSQYEVMHVRLFMADLNNGYEQLFILPGGVTTPESVPEPGTMLLMGIGAAGAAFMRRRAKKS